MSWFTESYFETKMSERMGKCEERMRSVSMSLEGLRDEIDSVRRMRGDFEKEIIVQRNRLANVIAGYEAVQARISEGSDKFASKLATKYQKQLLKATEQFNAAYKLFRVRARKRGGLGRSSRPTNSKCLKRNNPSRNSST